MMIVLCREPPMFDEIDAAFHVKGKEVIFAWGDKIYNPQNIEVGDELMAHEMVHGMRQGDRVEEWWRRYLYDKAFRLAEEAPAHRAELQVLLRRARGRNDRRYYTKHVAGKLASPLYGGLITPAKAKFVLTHEEPHHVVHDVYGNAHAEG